MDDTRTQDQLDALADLFLTGAETKAGAAPRATGTDVRDQLHGPSPIRLGPKRVPPRPHRAEPPSDGPRLRLHRPDPEATEPESEHPPTSADRFEVDPAPVEAVVEAVLLGNLPGFGGPWLTQYAQLLANEHGPVVILHVDEQRLDAELIQPAGSNALSGFEFSVAEDCPADSVPAVDMLNVLLRLQPTPVRMMLVNLMGEEARLAPRLARMKLWTLLTGHDDLATTAAASLIQRLLAGTGHATPSPAPLNAPAAGTTNLAEPPEPREPGELSDFPDLSDFPGVGLMVMGGDESQARAAAATVNGLLTGRLPAALPLVGHLRQMGPVNVKQLGSFAMSPGVWTALEELFDRVMPRMPAFESAAPAEAPPPPPAPAVAKVKPRIADAVKRPRIERQVATDDDWALRGDLPRMKPRSADLAAPLAVAAAASPRPSASAGFEPRPATLDIPVTGPASPPVPAPAASPDPIADADADPDLVSMLLEASGGAIQGVALEARCPRHGTVQLLLDDTGQLHLLKRHRFDRDGNGDGVRRALLELIETESWTREHRQLLALASRPHTFNSAARPRLHLFTDRADLVTPLVGRTDLPLKLHLLQEVDLPTGSAWFCTPLS